ncbi:hypothetical protein L596_016986 [Steinernema carpocapsae]|uniref:Uncharacterized protein n=1 Tax=Steinernema carpocapsae TaxID=34508 RepID=A0A4V6A1R1_STECR|nr:hypothetical protein L596_016986 [Steinernema carpocapsae]
MRLLLLLFLGVLSIASAVLVNSGCPKEAVPSEDGKTCFTIVKAKVKINVAVNVCKSFGGVITEDAGEYNYLMGMFLLTVPLNF